MRPLLKGILIAVIQVGIVSALGAKYLYDRAVCPRVWMLTVPYDPNLPIRGRYVRLQLAVAPEDMKVVKGLTPHVLLRVENGRAIAQTVNAEQDYNMNAFQLRTLDQPKKQLALLEPAVAFFIPERVQDPSRREKDEELWVEVTIPKNGPPRPIRLGVKKASGPIVPLDLK